MFVRVRSGGNAAGRVLSVHRTFQAANTRSGMKVFECILPTLPGERLRVDDIMPDWRDRWHQRMAEIRKPRVYKERY